MKKFALGALVGVTGLGLIVSAIPLSGLYNVAATERDSAPVAWFLHVTFHRSVARRAANIEVPDDFATGDSVLVGARNFDAMCSTCHTPPGLEETPVASGLNPRPPSLEKISAYGTPAERFWVISNGVRMTGMAAFGPTHEASELWNIVAFLEAMQDADAGRYNSLVSEARTRFGADDGHGHRHGSATTGGHHGADADTHHDIDADQSEHGKPPAQQDNDHSGHDHDH